MRPPRNEWLSRKCFSLPLAVLMLVQHLARKSSAPTPAVTLFVRLAALTASSLTLRRAGILANEKKYAYHKQEYAKQGRIDNRFPEILTLGITRELITGRKGHIESFQRRPVGNRHTNRELRGR